MIGRPFSHWKSGWLFDLRLAIQLSIFQAQHPVNPRSQAAVMRDHDIVSLAAPARGKSQKSPRQ
jgi:hypothetical protein